MGVALDQFGDVRRQDRAGFDDGVIEQLGFGALRVR